VSPGALIRDARRRHGLTQAQLAARARTSQAAISRIERDLVSPSVAKLSELLGLVGEELELSVRPLPNDVNRDVLRANLELTPSERIDQGVELGAIVRGRAHRHTDAPTLHLEIARILRENGDGWLTTHEVAALVNEAGRYERDAPGPVTPYQVHSRTKNYPAVFERRGSRIRLHGAVEAS
jgi:transcriptional regulator with XRE-family HTH domain